MNPSEIYTFQDAEKLVLDFETILKKHNIKIMQGSELERLCLNTMDTLEKHYNPNLRDPIADIRQPFREFIGLKDLLSKIIAVENDDNFKDLIPHLKKLNEVNPLQNVKTPSVNQDNNKIFELLIATLCMKLAGNGISLDHPNNSKGNNPDVIVNYRGKKWGLGCKALHSEHPKSLFDNIVKAVSQIENSDSEKGIPVINIKNITKHDQFWPILNEEEFRNGAEPDIGAFISKDVPFAKMQLQVDEIQQKLVAEVGLDNILELFKEKRSEPACLLYFPVVTSVVKDGNPVTTRLNGFFLLYFDDISKDCEDLCKELNIHLQAV